MFAVGGFERELETEASAKAAVELKIAAESFDALAHSPQAVAFDVIAAATVVLNFEHA